MNSTSLNNTVRIASLVSVYKAESGHPGGVLSSIDIIAYLYMKEKRKPG